MEWMEGKRERSRYKGTMEVGYKTKKTDRQRIMKKMCFCVHYWA